MNILIGVIVYLILAGGTLLFVHNATSKKIDEK